MASREYWFRSRTISLKWRIETLVMSGFFCGPLKIFLRPVFCDCVTKPLATGLITRTWHRGRLTIFSQTWSMTLITESWFPPFGVLHALHLTLA